MTVFMTGQTGKTGFSLFFTHRNQIEKREKIFSVFNRECNYPGLSGSSGKRLSARRIWKKTLLPQSCGI